MVGHGHAEDIEVIADLRERGRIRIAGVEQPGDLARFSGVQRQLSLPVPVPDRPEFPIEGRLLHVRHVDVLAGFPAGKRAQMIVGQPGAGVAGREQHDQ